MAECIDRNPELPKQDCTSPSPTETVCIESLCVENNPGTSQRNKHSQDISFNEDNYNIEEVEILEKNNFLNELGLIQDCEDYQNKNKYDDDDNKEDCWEDYVDQNFSEGSGENLDDSSGEEEHNNCLFGQSVTPKSSKLNRSKSDLTERILRKRKLDVNNGYPSKKSQPESPMSESKTNVSSLGACTPSGRPRAVIPTKDNPPPEMSEWLLQFSTWSNAERIMAINELIERCEPTQVRHMMQFQIC